MIMWIWFIGVFLVLIGVEIREQSLYRNIARYKVSEMDIKRIIGYIISFVFIIGGLLLTSLE